MNRKVLLLSASFGCAKCTGAELTATATHSTLLDDPNAPSNAEQRAAHWKVWSVYGELATSTYSTKRTRQLPMSCQGCLYAVFHRVLSEVDGGYQSLVLPSCWILLLGQAHHLGK